MTSPEGYEFSPDDSAECIVSYIAAESAVLDVPTDSAPREELDTLYQTILDYRDGQGIELIDNNQLLQFKILAFDRDGGPNQFILPSSEVEALFFR